MNVAPALRPLAELEAQASGLLHVPAWRALEDQARRVTAGSLRALLDTAGRYERFSRTGAGLHLDYSRQCIDEQVAALLLELAAERRLADWVGHLFAGSAVNSTEQRPALHMALRDRGTSALWVGGEDVRALARNERERMLSFAQAVGAGGHRGATGEAIRDVVNIGIGGSDLGLVMATEALRPFSRQGLRCHFVSNIDGLELVRIFETLRPQTTLFIICSKSFTTLETRLNAEAARDWVLAHLPASAIARHFAAVSTNDAAMDEFGIAIPCRFRIWDWIGGRYSLWSSVGLAIAIALGPENFRALLDGAAAMDEHFRTTEFAGNLPVLLGLLGVWNQNFLGASSHAVLPYTQGLHRFPAFLQQLEMESNGKSVTRDGQPVRWQTGTVVWGEPGSNAQHSFFQLLHQGTARFSADFIAPACAVSGNAGQHLAGLANMLAQAEAFARGRDLAEIEVSQPAAAGRQGLAAHRVHPGGHPSSIILFDRLDPWHLGALTALYEHKVFVQSVIWGINPFDQWGVELGKSLASTFARALTGPVEDADSLPGIGHRIRAGFTRARDDK